MNKKKIVEAVTGFAAVTAIGASAMFVVTAMDSPTTENVDKAPTVTLEPPNTHPPVLPPSEPILSVPETTAEVMRPASEPVVQAKKPPVVTVVIPAPDVPEVIANVPVPEPIAEPIAEISEPAPPPTTIRTRVPCPEDYPVDAVCKG